MAGQLSDADMQPDGRSGITPLHRRDRPRRVRRGAGRRRRPSSCRSARLRAVAAGTARCRRCCATWSADPPAGSRTTRRRRRARCGASGGPSARRPPSRPRILLEMVQHAGRGGPRPRLRRRHPARPRAASSCGFDSLAAGRPAQPARRRHRAAAARHDRLRPADTRGAGPLPADELLDERAASALGARRTGPPRSGPGRRPAPTTRTRPGRRPPAQPARRLGRPAEPARRQRRPARRHRRELFDLLDDELGIA